MEWKCKRCGETAPGGWDYCRACLRAMGKEWRERNKDNRYIVAVTWRKAE